MDRQQWTTTTTTTFATTVSIVIIIGDHIGLTFDRVGLCSEANLVNCVRSSFSLVMHSASNTTRLCQWGQLANDELSIFFFILDVTSSPGVVLLLLSLSLSLNLPVSERRTTKCNNKNKKVWSFVIDNR